MFHGRSLVPPAEKRYGVEEPHSSRTSATISCCQHEGCIGPVLAWGPNKPGADLTRESAGRALVDLGGALTVNVTKANLRIDDGEAAVGAGQAAKRSKHE